MGLDHRTTQISKATCTSSARHRLRSRRRTRPFPMTTRGLCPMDGNLRRTTSRIAYLISTERHATVSHSDRTHSHGIETARKFPRPLFLTPKSTLQPISSAGPPQGNPRPYFYRSGDRESTWDDPRSTLRKQHMPNYIAKATPNPHQSSSASLSDASCF